MTDLPAAARLVVWANASLSGAVSLDEATDRVAAGDVPHRVTGLPQEENAVSIALAIGRLRSLGVAGLRLVLPVPGDPQGLPGPTAVNEVAVEAGEAALTVGGPPLAILPSGRASWTAYDVAVTTASVLSLREAQQLLTAQMRDGIDRLTQLDVAAWQPDAATLLASRRELPVPLLPPSYPGPAHALLATALRVRAILELGARTPGGAVTASEMTERSTTLGGLEAAARRAVEAACNAPLG